MFENNLAFGNAIRYIVAIGGPVGNDEFIGSLFFRVLFLYLFFKSLLIEI